MTLESVARRHDSEVILPFGCSYRKVSEEECVPELKWQLIEVMSSDEYFWGFDQLGGMVVHAAVGGMRAAD